MKTAAPRLLGELLAVARRGGEDDDLSPLRIEGYRITGPLGEGGMGVVWRAEQVSTGRAVALKVMNVSAFGSRKARARFEREVELTARLEHPGIARLYESGVCRGAFYYAMELIEGLPLDRYAVERGLRHPDVCRLMAEVCRAVQHAHGRGVIHRDLKPANVLVTADGKPHLLDFGLAGVTTDPAVSQSLSLGAEITGTLGFMSPGQAGGAGAPDTRDDVFSLGAMLFLLLVGRLPHDPGGSPLEVIRRVAERDAPRPRSLDGSIHADLDAIVLKALAREPGRRYASAGELADDLERHLSGQPVSARPPTLAYYAGKAVRRHRVAVAAAAVSGCTLAGVATWAQWRVLRERSVAVTERRIAQAERGVAQSQRRLAERRLVESRVSQGDALAEAGRWTEATQAYAAARQAADDSGTSDPAVGLALTRAVLAAPPPLNEYRGHAGPVRATAISPDARRVASGGADGTVRVWDLASGRALLTLTGHGRPVTCLAFSADGRRIASGGDDQNVRLWDVAGGSQRLRLPIRSAIRALALSPDGKSLAVAAADKSWSLWDLGDGRRRWAVRYGNGTLSVAFSPDSELCLTSDEFRTYVWDTKGGEPAEPAYSFPSGVSEAVAVSPDRDRFLVGGASRTTEGAPLKLWELRRDGGILTEFNAQPCGARQVAFAGDGRHALVAGEDAVVRRVDLKDRTVEPVCFGQGAPLSAVSLSAVSLSADRGLAASGSADGTVFVWDAAGSERSAMEIELSSPAACLAVTADGSRCLAGASNNGVVRSLARGESAVAPFLPAQGTAARVLTFSPDQSLLLTGAADGAIRLWQGTSGAPLGLLGRHDADVRAIACSPDGRLALSVNGNEARLWDLTARRMLWSRRGGATLAHGAVFAADARTVQAATVHGRLVAWDVATGAPRPGAPGLQDGDHLEHPVIFLGDASRVVSAPEHDVLLWDVATGRMTHRLRGHGDVVEALAVTPDDRLIASGSRDGTTRLWEAATGRPLAVLRHKAGPVTVLRFSPDGRRLFAVESDTRLVVWQLDRADQVERFQERARVARDALRNDPDDAEALQSLEEWYRFRCRPDLADGITRHNKP